MNFLLSQKQGRRWSRVGRRLSGLLLILGLLLPGPVPGLVQAAPLAQTPVYQDPNAAVPDRVADLLARMTLDEKIGQMTQADRGALTAQADIATYFLGSILSGGGSAPANNTAAGWADMYDGYQNTALSTRLGIPLIYGIDAVHGHNAVYGATIFPHNIGLGATRNPALVQQVGQATAEEVSGTGIDWTFSPCLCVARNVRWGRTYESFGEDPALVQSMAPIIDGYQGTTLDGPTSILATAKHYVGDGGTAGGQDQGNTQLSETDLRALHLAPYVTAIQHDVGAIMVSFSSWNGTKMHGNQYLITTVLKGELGFTGLVVSDWAGVDQISTDYATAVRTAINAGIDMVMVPTDYRTFISTLRAEVNAGRVAQARIDDAVSRILTKKFELGLFESPLTDRTYTGTVGSAEHRALARQAVRESLVLLKNANQILPLPKTLSKIFVAGKSADNIGNQSGGWTISWQGSSGNITSGTTILQGIRNTVSGATVTYNSAGTGIDSSYQVAIVVVGETPYAEGNGDRLSPDTLSLDSTDLNTLNTVKASGVPMVVVMVSGRPLEVSTQLANWNAFVAAWLPGTEGQGVADVLFGDYDFTGKLPQTWFTSASQEPINVGDASYSPLFPFGYGLSYITDPTATPTATATGTPSPPTRTNTVSPTATRTNTNLTPTRTPTRTNTSVTPTYTPTYTPGTPTSGCKVTYTKNQWSNGFTADVKITNNTAAAISGWTLTWSFANGQQVTSAWNATVTQSGVNVTASNPASYWNGNIAANGGTASFGFQATFSGTNTDPTDFALNGVACNGINVTPSATPTRTNTSLTPTNTPTRTNTSLTPSATPTRTNTSLTPTNTPTRTNTSVTPTYTPTYTPGTPTQGCKVTYTTNQWSTGFTAEVKITNNSSSALSGWTLVWSFANGQQITGSWNATVTQSGANVTASNPASHWNGTIAANGGSVSFGFQATHSGTNAIPVNFALNGTTCQ